MPPAVPQADGIRAAHAPELGRTRNSGLRLDGLEPASVVKLSAEEAQIHMWLIQRQGREACDQDRQVEGGAAERHQQIVLRQFVAETRSGQRLPAHERRQASVPVQTDHGDLAEGVSFDVEIDRAGPQPFVEPPLIAREQLHGEVTRVFAHAMFLRPRHIVIVEGFPGRADLRDGAGCQKVRPRPDPTPPEAPFRPGTDAGQEAKRRLDHRRTPLAGSNRSVRCGRTGEAFYQR